MQRTRLCNPWSNERWEPVEVETCEGGPALTRLPDAVGGERWRFDGCPLELHRVEAEGYYLNLSAPDPRVFVMWRMLEPEARSVDGPAAAPFVVTVSYNEAARMLDGGEQVDSVRDAPGHPRLAGALRQGTLQARAAAQGAPARSPGRRGADRAAPGRRRRNQAMTNRDDPKRFTLRRWSARKLDAARATPAPAEPPAPDVAPAAAAPPAHVGPARNAGDARVPDGAEERALPPLDALTFESDFTAFLQPKVTEALKRQALKKLFSDPRFNVMDGLDVYIDDYTRPSPLEPELVKELLHARFTLDPPRTRVDAEGCVEDVPPDAVTGTLEDPIAPAGAGGGAPEALPQDASASVRQVAATALPRPTDGEDT